MRKTLIIFLWLLSITALAQDAEVSELCKKIDEAISEFPHYVAQHEAKITATRRAYEQETDLKQRYSAAFKLYELYRPFVSDSAIYFLRQCATIADHIGDPSSALRCRSLLALRCSNIGMYDEAKITLDSITPSDQLDKTALGTYYAAYNNVYSELAYYTNLDDMRKTYLERAAHYEALK